MSQSNMTDTGDLIVTASEPSSTAESRISVFGQSSMTTGESSVGGNPGTSSCTTPTSEPSKTASVEASITVIGDQCRTVASEEFNITVTEESRMPMTGADEPNMAEVVEVNNDMSGSTNECEPAILNTMIGTNDLTLQSKIICFCVYQYLSSSLAFGIMFEINQYVTLKGYQIYNM